MDVVVVARTLVNFVADTGPGDGRSSYGNDQYENQNKVKQKNGVAVGPVALKPYPQHFRRKGKCCLFRRLVCPYNSVRNCHGD